MSTQKLILDRMSFELDILQNMLKYSVSKELGTIESLCGMIERMQKKLFAIAQNCDIHGNQ